MSDTTPTEWTIGNLLSWTRGYLDAQGIEEPRLCAELLLAKALGCQKIALYTRFNEQPSESQRSDFRQLVKAAATHEPIAYLIGEKEFYSLNFHVTPDVLIPRPETELIVEHALAWCEQQAQDAFHMLDVGTGSGCIAIAIARRNAAVRAVATDISESALAVARKNADRHAVTDRILFAQADLLSIPADDIPDGGFDIIVSNPPYIATADRQTLPENVRDHEPEVALMIGDGLDAFRGLATTVHELLRPGGVLFLEVGQGQADTVNRLFNDAARLESVNRFQDLAGIDRTLQLRRPA